MTAIAACIFDAGIIIAADGASYDQEGWLRAPTSKIFTLPHLDCVFATTGLGGFGTALLKAMDAKFSSFEQLVKYVVPLAKLVYAECIGEEADAPRATLFIAGFMPAQKAFRAFKLHSSPKEVINSQSGESSMTPAWTLVPVTGNWISTWPGEAIFKEFGVYDPDMATTDFVARVVCANRAKTKNDDDAVFGVGCFLEMAIVTTQSTKRWIAHRWPDPMGEPIDPSRGERMPIFPLSIPG